MKKTALSLFMLFAAAPPAAHAAEAVMEKAFAAKDVDKLALRNGSGDIDVQVSKDASAHVKGTRLRGSEEDCLMTAELQGRTLAVSSEHKHHWGGCDIRWEVQVPREIGLDLNTGSGSIQVNGTKGPLLFKTGSGDIKVNATLLAVQGRAGSGNVQLAGLTDSVNLHSGSGDITLAFTSVPTQGEIEIRSGSGDIHIGLPASAVIDIDYRAGSGRLRSDFGSSDGAKLAVRARTGSGDLVIKKNK